MFLNIPQQLRLHLSATEWPLPSLNNPKLTSFIPFKDAPSDPVWTSHTLKCPEMLLKVSKYLLDNCNHC